MKKVTPPYYFENIDKTVYIREKINGKYQFVSLGKIDSVADRIYETHRQINVYICFYRYWRHDKMKWCPNCGIWEEEE